MVETVAWYKEYYKNQGNINEKTKEQIERYTKKELEI